RADRRHVGEKNNGPGDDCTGKLGRGGTPQHDGLGSSVAVQMVAGRRPVNGNRTARGRLGRLPAGPSRTHDYEEVIFRPSSWRRPPVRKTGRPTVAIAGGRARPVGWWGTTPLRAAFASRTPRGRLFPARPGGPVSLPHTRNSSGPESVGTQRGR